VKDDAAMTVVTRPSRAPRSRRARRRPSRRSLWAVLLALLAAVAAFVAVFLVAGPGHTHHGGTGGGGGGGGTGTVVPLQGVGDYDPQGNGGEHSSTAPLATDGDSSTYWMTESYGNQDFGGLKDGVGLVLDAGGPVKLTQLTVKTPTPGFTAEIQSGNSSTGGFTVDSSSQPVNGTTTFTLNGQTARYYVVWVTQLPPGLRAEISEVTAKR
jgi:hypothetical protein